MDIDRDRAQEFLALGQEHVQDEPATAAAAFEEAAERFAAQGLGREQVQALIQAGQARLAGGDAAGASGSFDRAAQAADALPDASLLLQARWGGSAAAISGGDWAGALACTTEALAVGERHGITEHSPLIQLDQGRALLHLDRPLEALQALTDARPGLIGRAATLLVDADLLRVRAMLCLGLDEGALDLAERTARLARSQGDGWLRATALDLLHQAQLRDGRTAAALRSARKARARWLQLGQTRQAARSQRSAGDALRQLGRASAARGAWADASAVFEALKLVAERRWTDVRLADLERSEGDTDEAALRGLRVLDAILAQDQPFLDPADALQLGDLVGDLRQLEEPAERLAGLADLWKRCSEPLADAVRSLPDGAARFGVRAVRAYLRWSLDDPAGWAEAVELLAAEEIEEHGPAQLRVYAITGLGSPIADRALGRVARAMALRWTLHELEGMDELAERLLELTAGER